MKKQMIQALSNHAIANIHLHKTNIDIYFANPAGIGEHSDILEAVQSELDKIAVHEDRLAILRNWPQGDKNEEQQNKK
tara:strand:+ start:308 stop:541 length:234 start_codon:yes stop_codon:yes gene_type:complete